MNVGENHIERKKSIAEKHAFLSLYIYFLFRSVVFSISFLYYETANLALITGHHATTIHNNSKRQTSHVVISFPDSFVHLTLYNNHAVQTYLHESHT
jgi:hypothetical protein